MIAAADVVRVAVTFRALAAMDFGSGMRSSAYKVFRPAKTVSLSPSSFLPRSLLTSFEPSLSQLIWLLYGRCFTVGVLCLYLFQFLFSSFFFRAQRTNDSRENKKKCEWKKGLRLRAAEISTSESSVSSSSSFSFFFSFL